ncbi:MAG: rhodanese-like domain-containing protein [Fibromonadaceae bacterium]|jgi:rhodanese-related sulfurtransferase|nr:rhodanese-like domain-containing protein [Fibromonadaceae bacterium]
MNTLSRLAFLVFACFLFCCNSEEQPKKGSDTQAAAKIMKIPAEQAKAIMRGRKAHILIDVRTEEEFKSKHIESAINIPLDEISTRAASLTDKGTIVLVYCKSGGRSASAAKEFIKLGYSSVYDLGGIDDWPYGTVGD